MNCQRAKERQKRQLDLVWGSQWSSLFLCSKEQEGNQELLGALTSSLKATGFASIPSYSVTIKSKVESLDEISRYWVHILFSSRTVQ